MVAAFTRRRHGRRKAGAGGAVEEKNQRNNHADVNRELQVNEQRRDERDDKYDDF